MRFVSPEQEVNDIQLLMDKQILFAKEIKGALDGQMGPFALALAKAGTPQSKLCRNVCTSRTPMTSSSTCRSWSRPARTRAPPPNAGMPGQLPVVGGPSMMQRMTMKPDGTRFTRFSTRPAKPRTPVAAVQHHRPSAKSSRWCRPGLSNLTNFRRRSSRRCWR